MLRLVLIAACLVLCASGQEALRDSIERALGEPAARRASWGIHVIESGSGRVLYQRNAGVPFTPASNAKLFSTALALLRLGPDHRFETRVVAEGKIDNGVLRGDLLLAGGGDPTLSARVIPYRKGTPEGDPLQALDELAAQVAAAGVSRIEGDLVGDDTWYPWDAYPSGWSVDDGVMGYGAGVSALTLNDNTLSLSARPARRAGEPAELSLRPPVEYFWLQNDFRTGAGLPRRLELDRAPGSRVLRVSGSAPPDSGAFTQSIAVDDPALFAAQAFAEALARRGVALNGRITARHRAAGRAYSAPQGALLARRVSPPLVETLRIINKVSQNLHAELVLREVARVRRGDGTLANGVEELAGWLEELGIAKDEADLRDASGLSRGSLITPAALTRLLLYMHGSAYAAEWYSLLPVGGVDGTLEGRMAGFAEAATIRAKTGSLSHVAALSGYAGPQRRLIFAIVSNAATAPAGEVRRVIDTIAVAIAGAAGQ
jgi:D-alanyl-D-alanine carboxypeptidase/D-alanyl-D-alanine-endopeptidase (penicillin-binding protein 4)